MKILDVIKDIDLNEFNMCYLDTVFVDSTDSIKYAKVYFCNKLFTDIYSLIVPYSELIQLTKIPCLHDFEIEGKYFKCATIKRVQITENVEENVYKVQHHFSSKPQTFYDFVREASNNDYLFVGDSISELSAYKGTELSHFRYLKFSKSTMSVYFQITSNEGLYNRHLITLEGGYLQFHPFYFGVKESIGKEPNYGIYQHDITINNEKYKLYYVENISIIEDSTCIVPALINKAMGLKEKAIATNRVLEEIIKAFISSETIAWAGGSNSHESHFGVLYDYSIPRFKKRDIDFLAVKTLEFFDKATNSKQPVTKEFITEIFQQLGTNDIVCYVVVILAKIIEVSTTHTELLSYVTQFRTQEAQQALVAELYLYQTKVSSYFYHIPITSKVNPIIDGSDESGYTLVTSGFFYGGGN